MSPRAAVLLTGLATVAVVACAGYLLAIGDVVDVLPCLACGVAVAVAWVVVRHDATSAVGPALAWTTASIAVIGSHVGPLAALPWSSGAWPLNLAGLLVLLLVFPDGHLPGRRWRWVPIAFGVATLAVVVAQWGARQVDGALVGGPEGSWVAPVMVTAVVVIGGCLVLAAASLVLRHRRGPDRTRQQVRWLLLAGLAVVALLMGGWVAEAAGASIDVAYTPFLIATITLVPAGVGIAIVRYDLFDVDRLLTTTTSWLVTLLASAVVFGAVVLGVSRAVALGTGLAGGLAAFATALALLPLHRHVTSWVGRVVDPDRHVAVAAVERFAADVRAGRRQPEEIEVELRVVLGDPELVVHVGRPDGGWALLDGTPVDRPDGFDLRAGDDVIATVVLGWSSARARRRLAEVAQAAWVPIEVSRLRLALRESLAETDASRRRMVEASGAERRRLERDLHDGVQQRIVATGMRLRLLQERLPAPQAAEVDAAVGELKGTVDELRRVAQGVRPSMLDDGLAAALTAVEQTSPIPFDLVVGEIPPISEARALTAYFVVAEAVANALKHAHASRISVTVASHQGRLGVEVVDDGIGGLAPDVPLTALRDRIASVDGTLAVRSAPGAGTGITAVV